MSAWVRVEPTARLSARVNMSAGRILTSCVISERMTERVRVMRVMPPSTWSG